MMAEKGHNFMFTCIQTLNGFTSPPFFPKNLVKAWDVLSVAGPSFLSTRYNSHYYTAPMSVNESKVVVCDTQTYGKRSSMFIFDPPKISASPLFKHLAGTSWHGSVHTHMSALRQTCTSNAWLIFFLFTVLPWQFIEYFFPHRMVFKRAYAIGDLDASIQQSLAQRSTAGGTWLFERQWFIGLDGGLLDRVLPLCLCFLLTLGFQYLHWFEY